MAQRNRTNGVTRPSWRFHAQKLGVLALGLTVAVTLAACGAPGKTTTSQAPFTPITARVTAADVAKLGNVTLNVWADQGELATLKLLTPLYEKTYPNVKLQIQYKSFDDMTKTIVNAMNSSSAPDVAQGNQGYATDGALVNVGLIRPLDDVAKVYDYTAAAGNAISQLKWSKDGKQFGTGSIYGMAPDNQMVGVFYNKTKLQSLGIAVPTTLSKFEAALASAKQAGDLPITLGNSDKASAMQAFSIVQGAMTPAADTVGWITGKSGSNFDNSRNRAALDKWADWVKRGYFSPGYDGTSPDDAAKAFASGTGVFYIGGNWEAANIADSKTFGFMAAPAGESGINASNGSFGLPWHIGSRSTKTAAAIAFVGMINDPGFAQSLANVNRVPIFSQSVTAPTPMSLDLTKASKAQLGEDGSLYFYDWATPTMLDTFTSGLQEVMAGRTSSYDLLKTIQSNWTAFQKTR
jgi:raffinose/stachyose/melibiose transport system substrate-binding protein